MDAMRAFQLRVLVSTDLTARGVDLQHVNLVVRASLLNDRVVFSWRWGVGLVTTVVPGWSVCMCVSVLE